ncbi:junctional protein associated with coronary artery disease isoform X2 [Echinops telfairi]|uniref:Junctional protein associated with coronary artery disease isoform X2 n=1 Tax=Echinops telfairi TaxID=9371 RepID=A0AC55D1W5_ECHTE|nr:junctional protein associated with coronary artery disease isoform X2 [Echinops telfairi]
MYSVEDLLISHGYTLSRSLVPPREQNHEGHRPAGTRHRAGHGLLNGYEKDPTASAPRKSAPGRGGGAPRSPRPPQRASDVGFYHQPPSSPSAWTSQLPAGNDPGAWRKRGQEYSGPPGPRGWEDPDVRGSAQAPGRPVYLREDPWDVGARTENVTRKAFGEEELRMSGAAQWQSVSVESWLQPRKLGRQMSDGCSSGREKLFQDLYLPSPGEHVLHPQNKGKSQSLPKVLFPESLNYVEMPILLNDGHLMPGAPKMPLCPPHRAPSLESTRTTEKGGLAGPLPQPKFGRPLRPPSYELHQQARGGVDGGEHLDHQLADDLPAPRLTIASDPRQERSGSDSGLEPPVYVPPPSYHSPSPHITNPYLEDSAPRHGGRGFSQQLPPSEKTTASLETGTEYGVSPQSPCQHPQYPCPSSAHSTSVQYIPFDDPRIRHIKLTQPQGFCEDKPPEKFCNSRPAAPPDPARRKTQPGGAFSNVQSMPSTAGEEWAAATPMPGPLWLLGWPSRDREPGDIAHPRDGHAERGRGVDLKGAPGPRPGGPAPSPHLQADRTSETVTRLKKFETGLQTKKSSKKKKNETVFCLVSIPVKSESHLPETDQNNNDLGPSAHSRSPVLPEHSLLSMSSTDLELQALTRRMAGKTEPQTQGLSAAVARQTGDPRFACPTKHPELKYSGSWPSHQLRDQQTQTAFTQEPKRPQPLPSGEPGGPGHVVLTPNHLDPATSGAQMHTAPAPGDHTQRPSGRHFKGQTFLGPSSDSAFSRTSSAPKACPGQPRPGTQVPGAHPAPQGEVLKGEPTSPCNSQQLFGQFLLKPVNRRPWDLISQLESFNKELQEQSASREGSSEESEAEGPGVLSTNSGRQASSSAGFSQAVRGQQQPGMLGLEEPVGFRLGRKSGSEEQRAGPPTPGILQAGDNPGQAFRSEQGSGITEKGSQEAGTRSSQPGASPGPVARKTMEFGLCDTKPAPPLHPAEPREPQRGHTFANDVCVVEAKEEEEGEEEEAAQGREERETQVVYPLSLASKHRGLSAPDLRSQGQEPNTSESDEPLEQARAIDIPPKESLQERAERILGIEVAVESLLRAGRRAGLSRQRPEADESAFRPASPREEPPPPSALPRATAASKDAFYGRRKCGWTESPLFVGERDGTRRTPLESAHSGVDRALASGPEPLDPKDAETRPPFRSTLFHLVERSPSAEKRCRSTSRVIETLQEKLASPPRRADPDRLLRMRETLMTPAEWNGCDETSVTTGADCMPSDSLEPTSPAGPRVR